MNEPLTMSMPTFRGKSHNEHPHWKNTSLRLTQTQIADPRLVFEDFFECYHLNEVREVLWNWLVEVLSSRHAIAQDGLDRSNHIYFYEKAEALIEAAWVLQNRTDDTDDTNRSVSRQATALGYGSFITTDSMGKEPPLPFIKDIPLIGLAATDPNGIISRIFREESYEILSENLAVWYHMAITTENSVYEDLEQREQLIHFYKGLDELLLALQETCTKERDGQAQLVARLPDALKKEIAPFAGDRPLADPWLVITDFFKHFPMIYIAREMDDWLAAGISHVGSFSSELTKPEVLDTYRNMLCLITAAWQLVSKGVKEGGADSSGHGPAVAEGTPTRESAT